MRPLTSSSVAPPRPPPARSHSWHAPISRPAAMMSNSLAISLPDSDDEPDYYRHPSPSPSWWSFAPKQRYARLPQTSASSTRSSTPSDHPHYDGAGTAQHHLPHYDDVEKELMCRYCSSAQRSAQVGYHRPSHPVTLIQRSKRCARRACRRPSRVLCILGIVLGLVVWCTLAHVFQPPPYNLVARSEYEHVLSAFAWEQSLVPPFHGAQDEQERPTRWKESLATQLTSLGSRLEHTPTAHECTKNSTFASRLVPATTTVESMIPPSMYSSDHVAPPAYELQQWTQLWSSLGFEPHFLDEDAADAFVDAHFGVPNPHHSTQLTPTQKAWQELPRGVLRADFLRYILLLAHGGTWSDMDVTPLSHRETWTRPIHSLSNSCDSSTSTVVQEPIRLAVGIECEPWEYMTHSPRAWLEAARLLPMRRHRQVQFTQWSLHGSMGHPVLLDVLRRLVQKGQIFDSYTSSSTAPLQAKTHPWTSIGAARAWIPTIKDSTWKVWPGNWSLPRLGWHTLSVEEWTGPALWTDAVFSYLSAVSGIEPQELYGLKHPVQVADVLIAPNSWFNPGRGQNHLAHAKVVHNFRGSWKNGADSLRKGGSKPFMRR